MSKKSLQFPDFSNGVPDDQQKSFDALHPMLTKEPLTLQEVLQQGKKEATPKPPRAPATGAPVNSSPALPGAPSHAPSLEAKEESASIFGPLTKLPPLPALPVMKPLPELGTFLQRSMPKRGMDPSSSVPVLEASRIVPSSNMLVASPTAEPILPLPTNENIAGSRIPPKDPNVLVAETGYAWVTSPDGMTEARQPEIQKASSAPAVAKFPTTARPSSRRTPMKKLPGAPYAPKPKETAVRERTLGAPPLQIVRNPQSSPTRDTLVIPLDSTLRAHLQCLGEAYGLEADALVRMLIADRIRTDLKGQFIRPTVSRQRGYSYEDAED